MGLRKKSSISRNYLPLLSIAADENIAHYIQVKSLSGKLDASKKRLQQINETMRDIREKNNVIRWKLKDLNITGQLQPPAIYMSK